MRMLACSLLMILATTVFAADPPQPATPPPTPDDAMAAAKVTPELPADPKVMAIIDGLGAGEAAELPPIRTTGDINEVARSYGMDKHGPGGRNYCVKMMWMPERKRAIFCGANHGVPHRLNDVWEYDLPSNTWVCLYGPDKSKGKDMAGWSDTKVVDGVLRTERGGPAIIGHQWWQLDYDPELRAMLFLSSWTMFPNEVKTEMFPRNKHNPPLWAFYPEQKKWEPIMPKGKTPSTGIAVYFQYIPTLKKLAYVDAGYRMGGMWLYDSKTNTWESKHGGEDFKAKNNPATPVGDGVMVYAPDVNALVASTRNSGPGGRTSHYDVAADKWVAGPAGADVPAGHDSFTPCGYDTVGKVLLLLDQKTNQLWGYSPSQTKWSKLTPKGPPAVKGGPKAIGYYDQARNVLVINEGSRTWVYRHAAAPASKAAGDPSQK